MTTPAREPAQFSALIPFAGFYGSWHDQAIDDAEERLFSDDSGEVFNQKLYEMFWSNLNYRIVHKKYAKAFIDLLAAELGFPLEFEEMTSPREYNFETDRLFAKIHRADLAKMLRALREVRDSPVWTTRLDNKIAEELTSRSGFISSYPNHISRWPRIADWDHNHVGIVLSCYCDLLREQGKLPDESDMSDTISADCNIEGMLAEAAEGKAARALKINDYLRQRKERAYRHLPMSNPAWIVVDIAAHLSDCPPWDQGIREDLIPGLAQELAQRFDSTSIYDQLDLLACALLRERGLGPSDSEAPENPAPSATDA